MVTNLIRYKFVQKKKKKNRGKFPKIGSNDHNKDT